MTLQIRLGTTANKNSFPFFANFHAILIGALSSHRKSLCPSVCLSVLLGCEWISAMENLMGCWIIPGTHLEGRITVPYLARFSPIAIQSKKFWWTYSFNWQVSSEHTCWKINPQPFQFILFYFIQSNDALMNTPTTKIYPKWNRSLAYIIYSPLFLFL